MKTAVFTICSRNYLAYALSLKKSLEQAEPDTPFFIYLADKAPEPGRAPGDKVIPIEDLNLRDLHEMAFRYTVMEFNTAIKADCFLDLFNNRGFDAAIYLDPDIQVFAPLAEVHTAFENGASAVLTPHVRLPLPNNAPMRDVDFLKSGVFNLGFAGFAKTDESLVFIEWWARQLHADCYSAPEQGLFVDQRFADMAPCFIEHLRILRHFGYNVAYWNIANRKITRDGSRYHVNGEPLVFFHFSGVAPDDPGVFSKHLGEAGRTADDTVFMLVHAYQASLFENGHADWSRIPYAYHAFRDGTPILPPMRRAPPASGSASDWFEAPDFDYWTAPDPRLDPGPDIQITRLMMGFWDLRSDLQEAFSLGTAKGRLGLFNWFHKHGVREYGIPAKLTGHRKNGLRQLAQTIRLSLGKR